MMLSTVRAATNDAVSDGTTFNAGTSQRADHLPSSLLIMPLGDSITYGVGGSNHGYLGYLHSLLNSVSTNFLFVGAVDTAPYNHSGYPSYATLDLANNLDGYDPLCYQKYGGAFRNPLGGYWLVGGNGTGRNAVYPDIILLLVGANDINQGGAVHPEVTPANFQTNLTTLVNKLVTLRPKARLIVADMTPYANGDAQVTAMNTSINAVVATFQARGCHVSRVDLHTGFPANGLSPDGIHPNDTGYSWMASQWFAAIRDLLKLNRE